MNDFPSNVSIVSWNYDSQIEYAYNEYCKLSSLTEISARLHICDKLTTQDVNVAGFNIFKLNGCALVKGKDASIIDPFWGFFYLNVIQRQYSDHSCSVISGHMF